MTLCTNCEHPLHDHGDTMHARPDRPVVRIRGHSQRHVTDDNPTPRTLITLWEVDARA